MVKRALTMLGAFVMIAPAAIIGALALGGDGSVLSGGALGAIALLVIGGALGCASLFFERSAPTQRSFDHQPQADRQASEIEELKTRLDAANAERALIEDRFRALVELAPEAILVIDMDNKRFTEANPRAAELFGKSREVLMSECKLTTLNPEFQPDGRRSDEKGPELISKVLEGAPLVFEWQHRKADGTLIDCLVTLVRLPDPHRRMLRATLVELADTPSMRRDMGQHLAQTQKLETIGQMTGGVAHGFNNLLTVIMGNLELLRDTERDGPALELIDAALGAAERGATLTRSMLSFARRAHLSPERLDLNKMIAGMDAWMTRSLPETIRVVTRSASGLWPVKADLAAVESALLNLSVNARDAMPLGGVLMLETANVEITEAEASEDVPPGRYVVLSVTDSGTGIPSDVLPRVFDPFFSTKCKSRAKHSGLGLSMVHGFMKQSGGSVAITSSPGEGTQVRLFFPALDADVPQTYDAAPAAQAQPKAPARILLAEDQDDVLAVLKRALETAGHHVIVARNGDTALDLFNLFRPVDLLITDLVMPGALQGPDLAVKLRETHPELPVILLSGYAADDMQIEGMNGPNDVRLVKPVPRERLVEAVQAALGDRTRAAPTPVEDTRRNRQNVPS